MALDELAQRVRDLFLALGDLVEDGGFLDSAADPVADEDEHDGEEERHPPAPIEEGIARGDRGHQGEHARGQQEPDGHPDLREGTAQSA